MSKSTHITFGEIYTIQDNKLPCIDLPYSRAGSPLTPSFLYIYPQKAKPFVIKGLYTDCINLVHKTPEWYPLICHMNIHRFKPSIKCENIVTKDKIHFGAHKYLCIKDFHTRVFGLKTGFNVVFDTNIIDIRGEKGNRKCSTRNRILVFKNGDMRMLELTLRRFPKSWIKELDPYCL